MVGASLILCSMMMDIWADVSIRARVHCSDQVTPVSLLQSPQSHFDLTLCLSHFHFKITGTASGG